MDFRPIGWFVGSLWWCLHWSWTIVQQCWCCLDRSWAIVWSKWFVVMFVSWKSFWLTKFVMLFMRVLGCLFYLVIPSSSNSFRFCTLVSTFYFRSLVMLLFVCCSLMVCFLNVGLSICRILCDVSCSFTWQL